MKDKRGTLSCCAARCETRFLLLLLTHSSVFPLVQCVWAGDCCGSWRQDGTSWCPSCLSSMFSFLPGKSPWPSVFIPPCSCSCIFFLSCDKNMNRLFLFFLLCDSNVNMIIFFIHSSNTTLGLFINKYRNKNV